MPRHSSAASVASAVVIAIAAGFYVYAMAQGRNKSGEEEYALQGIFLSSDGLQPGADVRLAGVKVGSVLSITLDPVASVARVMFRIDDRYRLPMDTSLSIGSSGFTAANALIIDPGHEAQTFAPGATIRNTRELRSLEQTVGQYIFGSGGLGTGGGTP